MGNNLKDRCAIALQAYELATQVMAKRAGAAALPTGTPDRALLDRAARLAMPIQAGAKDNGLPALQSLVGHLHGSDRLAYYAPRLIEADRAAIVPQPTRPQDLAERYRTLWHEMQQEISGLPDNEASQPPAREVAYLGLLQRYAWAMAAPDAGDTDVSLYDYTRVQAALAVCMAEQNVGAAAVAVLVGGDVSGVQDWLYTIGSEGAARSLRGRSVYLQLLSEIVAQWILDNLDLPSCNLLYAGGGNFYLLAPLSAVGQIDVLQVEITRRLLKMHDGALYIALGCTEVTASELENAAIGEAWGRVNAAMSLRKRRRFAELADDAEMAQAIGSALHGTGRLEDSCHVCRRPIKGGGTDETGNEEEQVCQFCRSFEELGNQLPRAGFLVVSRLLTATTSAAVVDWNTGLRQFGYDVQFVRHAQESPREWQGQPSALVRIYFWQQQQPDRTDFPGTLDAVTSVWLYRPLAQAVPMRDGRVATFDQLEAEGIQRWGVLRMDVDKLGAIFQHGVQPASLSRVVGLSGMLRLFFEGYVPQLADGFNANERRRIYLMYAGGDDLFVVGGWSHLPGLAWKIREALCDFAAGNDQVTISAGISLALSERYPIYQAAADAGEAEEMAKREGRNRIAFLDQPVIWRAEGLHDFASVRRRVDELIALVGAGKKVNKSLIASLRQIDSEWRVWQKAENVAAPGPDNVGRPRYMHQHKRLYLGPWEWHLMYSLSRAADRTDDDIAKDQIKGYVDSIVSSEIEVLGLEARWAELLTRDREH